jgi:hypothetical protein
MNDLEPHAIRIAYENETILVDSDDDVEGHGILGVAAAVVVMAGSAGGTFLATSGSALAPEPARLTAELTGSNGSSGAAYYINTNQQTNVVKWPGTYMYNTTLAPGTPCSPYDLAEGAEATRVIQATGNYRKCI